MGRNTVQQAIIEQALHELGNHPTADEVLAHIAEAHPSISKATVYRTLNKLAENGKALKVSMNDGADRFDHNTHPHFHIRCSVCNRVDDVEIPVQIDLAEASKASGFTVESYTIQFKGICPNCK